MEEEEEYEIIPTSPVRRLEKRIHQLESTSSSSEVRKLIEQIVELIKANQRVIDDIIKSNAELRNEMSRVPGKIDELVGNMKDFMELLRASATEESVSELSKDVMAPVVSKMDEMIKQNRQSIEVGQAVLSNIETLDKRVKRLYTAPAGQQEY